ncbi:receptor-like protein EIX1 [Ricinus communis]|uniref:receptor-like protein EIX1 n=1 Tax=Ricinus communis TaxID=3988 RepID=UPI00201A8994|nr:receptor-like protein EIX1 [Ricinus communis]
MGIFLLLWVVLLHTCLMTGEVVYGGDAERVACKESEREALLDFRKGLEDTEDQLSSWHGSSCCHWWGITCDNITGHVTTIDLHNPSGYDTSTRYGTWTLSGIVRPSLKRLKSLKYLDLSFNTFNGRFPNFFSSLKNLEYLNLSNAGFSGPIPQNLGNLSNLHFLDISSQDLAVDNIEWVTGLVSLKYLAMVQIDLSEVGIGWVEALNKLPFLTELHLQLCGLSSLSSLPLINFTSLAVIDLSYNAFDSMLPNWLVNISTLVSVDISSSSLYGRIPLGFNELQNFQSLDLNRNENLSASCSKLFRGTWRKIQVLDLSNNKLHGRLHASLGNMTSLIVLQLYMNAIEGRIPSSIGMLCNLKHINLSLNKLTGSLPEFLEGAEHCLSKYPLSTLQHFEVSNNQLVGKLPDWISNLKNLVILDLADNSFEGPIPCFGDFLHLSELRLAANKFNGSLSDSIWLLSELFVLDVSHNRMSGVISEVKFLKLRKLSTLSLSSNSFILNFSSNWVPPFQLLSLNMGSCFLGPSFPAWLRYQKEIIFLDFSNSSISGPIPNWFWNISGRLTYLNLSINSLEGHLPSSFSTDLFEFIYQ